MAEDGELLFGTVDTWLMWNLTKGQVFATDYTNASRTMLFDIHKRQWDPEILDYFRFRKHASGGSAVERDVWRDGGIRDRRGNSDCRSCG